MKKLLFIAAFLIIAANGCKTRKSVQASKSENKTVKVDSVSAHKDSVSVDSSKLLTHVSSRDTFSESYEETNITITAPNSREIAVPTSLYLDSSSTLDSMKYTNGKTPATSLVIAKNPKNPNDATATLQTPTGKQVFTNWSSIQINTKKYTRTGTKSNDSLSASLLNKVIKNTFDTTAKHADTTTQKESKVNVQKQSDVSAKGLFAAFWWIPLTAIVLLLLIWKGGTFFNWIKSKL